MFDVTHVASQYCILAYGISFNVKRTQSNNLLSNRKQAPKSNLNFFSRFGEAMWWYWCLCDCASHSFCGHVSVLCEVFVSALCDVFDHLRCRVIMVSISWTDAKFILSLLIIKLYGVTSKAFSPNKLSLKVLNFWKLPSYCSLKLLWSGMGEVVPARTSLTLHPPSPPTVHKLSWLAL